MSTIPGDASTTARLTGTGIFGSTLDTNGDSDWWRFEAVAGRTYDFTLSGDGGANSLDDAYFRLRDASGTQITYDIVYNGQAETIQFTATTSGTYFIDVSDYSTSDGLPEGGYRIATRMNDWLPNNATTPAALINGVVSGILEANGDSDWYRVTLRAGQSVDFLLSGDASGTSLDDAYIRLRDANGTQLTYDTVFNGQGSWLAYTAATAGTYYIEVVDYSVSDQAPEGSFRLTSRLSDTVANSSLSTARLLDGGEFRSAIDASRDSDWVGFSAVAGRSYTFRLDGDGSTEALGGRYLRLRDANGNQIDYDYVYSSGEVSFTWNATSTAMVYLDVSGYGASNWGRYNLSVISNSVQLNGTAANDVLTGGANNNRIVGFAGNDVLNGGAGNDTLVGGSGNDTLNGGTGIDTADFSGTAPAQVYLGVTGAQNTWQGRDVFSSIENLLGGSGNDRFFGDAANNVLDGAAGNDQLYGGGGDDTLIGGAGNDFFNGGAGFDTIVFAGNAAVVADIVSTRATGQGNDTIGGVENLTGGNGNDVLRGNAAKNVLIGGAGADTIVGRGGSDVLTGGAGADRFVFANYEGNDRITDFQDGIDRIEIGGPTNSFADLTIVNGGGNAVVSWGGGTTITLTGITAAQLSAADFIFV